MNNPITQETIQLVYEAGHNPTKLVEVHNNKVNNIIYEGKKITNYGNNEYKYNEEGIRTYKKEPAYNGTTQIGYDIHNYILEGEKILTEIINTAYYGLIRFDYNYDINGELVSLEFQGQTYYYVKDALGVIHSIIDIYGNVMVSYKYDEWGKLLNIDALDPYHPVAKYNPYIYKTYYYDYESKMYYLNSRYYHPSIRRFLTIDDINYLEYEALSSLNLYQYCKDNPLMRKDNTGKLSFIVGLAWSVAAGLVSAAFQVVDNIANGKEGSDVFENVLGSFLSSTVNSAITLTCGVVGIITGAIASSVIQTNIDYVESLLRGKDQELDEYYTNYLTNFSYSLLGNIVGEKFVPIHSGQFVPKNLISAFFGKYGSRIMLQTVVGDGASVVINKINEVIKEIC